MQLFKQCSSYNVQINLTITTNPLCTNLRCTCIDTEIFLRGRVFSVSLRCEFNRLLYLSFVGGEISDPSRSAHVAIQESNLLLLCAN